MTTTDRMDTVRFAAEVARRRGDSLVADALDAMVDEFAALRSMVETRVAGLAEHDEALAERMAVVARNRILRGGDMPVVLHR